MAFCLGIRNFKIPELGIHIVNPFFGAKTIVNAKLKEEAVIQADLWFPGDNSEKVHAYIVEKATERHIDGKERQLAF